MFSKPPRLVVRELSEVSPSPLDISRAQRETYVNAETLQPTHLSSKSVSGNQKHHVKGASKKASKKSRMKYASSGNSSEGSIEDESGADKILRKHDEKIRQCAVSHHVKR